MTPGARQLELLRLAGVDDPAGLVTRAEAAWPEPFGPALVDALAASADPALAVASLGRLREAHPDVVAAVAREPAAGASLVGVLGASPLVARLLLIEPDCWRAALVPGAGGGVRPVPPGETPTAPEELARSLRAFKRRSMLVIAAWDLLGRSTLEDTTAALTTLAEEALDAAIAATRARLVAEYGDAVADGQPLGFTVLGMGKLGGIELNFSSDVDLVYLYERDAGETAGGRRGALSTREFFSRLAEAVTRAMHQATDDGFVFRVDLRLRPDGANGPIVSAAQNLLLYYESWGQTWERAAYLKARPVAGDRVLGTRVLADLVPFVYRRYLDYATLEDIKAMKDKIANALGGGRARGPNVKLGRGGIREIEFIIQSLQLVHAGKDARIRERNSLRALERLAETRYLAQEEAATLAAAYRFLREVEHKIQLVDERQTHVIPSGDGERQLARRLGYARDDPAGAVDRFRADCARHMDAVHAAFTTVFYSSRAEIGEAADPRFASLLASLEDPDAARAQLAVLGFRDVEGGLAHLHLLRDGSPTAPATPRRKELLVEVAPALFAAITRAPDPDLALRNLAGFLQAIGARSSFLSLLAENPSTLRTLVRLFGSSAFLSQVLIRHPEMLDNLVRADLVRLEMSKEAMRAEIQSVVAATTGYEELLDALRLFRAEQFLRIGINDLENLLPFNVVSSQLSDLADVSLEAACAVAESETLRRYGVAALPGRFAVIGMGKLGSRELTYNSDLDLIFVYDVPPDAGDAPPAHELYTRLAQILITTLQVQTRQGRMYRIDTRLRPSGNAGPLVSSRDAFARYHTDSSQLWERQALIKARAVAGDAALMAEVDGIIQRFVYARPLDDREVAEIHRLRMRMEHEIAGDEREEYNIKTGRGGLVDIEFLTQMLQLRHGAAVPAVRRRATRHALAALAEVGVLPPEDAATLAESYVFLRTLTNRLRIEHDRPVEELERAGDGLAPLARRLGYEGTNAAVAERLLADYARHRERVRALYSKWFGVE